MKRILKAVMAVLLFAGSTALTAYGEENGKEQESEPVYDYKGTVSGVLNADARQVFVGSQTISTADAGRCILTARSGGSLFVSGMKFQKSGDGSDEQEALNYGVNAMAASVGPNSLIQITDTDMSSMSLNSAVLFAADHAKLYAKNVTISSSKDASPALRAAYGGLIIGKDLKISSNGIKSAGVSIGTGGGTVTIEDCEIYTHGQQAPLAEVSGTAELRRVNGTATGSGIITMCGGSIVRMRHSKLGSTWKNTVGDAGIACGIEITKGNGKKATLQIADSTLSSSVESGAMIAVSDTPVSVFVRSSDLAFDAEKAGLLSAAGENAAVSVTAVNETMQGDVILYPGASCRMYLLEGSVWYGSVRTETAEEEEKPYSCVTVDASSVWILKEDCEVTDLVLEDGASVTDEEGRLVSIRREGKRVFYGNSSLTLTVNGEIREEIDLSGAAKEVPFQISRKEFDESVKDDTERKDPVPGPIEPEHVISNGNLSGIIAGTCVFILTVITLIIRKK